MKLQNLLVVSIVALPANATFAADPLPSRNDTAPKQASGALVEKVTKEGGADFVPPAERITYFRLYGPTQPYFDKTWVLPDIERVKRSDQL